MTDILKNLIHGRETYIADFGADFVMKRPLPTLGEDARQKWLMKQHRTKEIIDDIIFDVYNVFLSIGNV